MMCDRTEVDEQSSSNEVIARGGIIDCEIVFKVQKWLKTNVRAVALLRLRGAGRLNSLTGLAVAGCKFCR